jgi:hypothetical protein
MVAPALVRVVRSVVVRVTSGCWASSTLALGFRMRPSDRAGDVEMVLIEYAQELRAPSRLPARRSAGGRGRLAGGTC